MYYEINVSFKGNHYFATAERSLTNREAADKAYDDFEKRFPKSEGFKISMTQYSHTGTSIKQNYNNKEIS